MDIGRIVGELERAAGAIRVGILLAEWVPWMLLAAVALLAAWLGWAARGLREGRSKPAVFFNTTTGFYECSVDGGRHELVLAPVRAGKLANEDQAERHE